MYLKSKESTRPSGESKLTAGPYTANRSYSPQSDNLVRLHHILGTGPYAQATFGTSPSKTSLSPHHTLLIVLRGPHVHTLRVDFFKNQYYLVSSPINQVNDKTE